MTWQDDPKGGAHIMQEETNSSLIRFEDHKRRETTPGTGNLPKYPGIVSSWILKENLLPPLYQANNS